MRGGRQSRARLLAWAAPILAIAVLTAACSPAASASPTSMVPGVTPAATIEASPVVSSTPGTTPAVELDPSLLAVLPSTIAGFAMAESPEAEAAAREDPQLAVVGSAMVAGIAVDASAGEFVYAVVVRLKAGAMNDAVFRDWRDSYDQGACSQANGVAGNAQTEIDGRTVYIGTCGGGVRTYHVWIEDKGLLVSASSVGDRRLGELLMNSLRVP